MRNSEFAYENLLDSLEQSIEVAYLEANKEDFKDVFIATQYYFNYGKHKMKHFDLDKLSVEEIEELKKRQLNRFYLSISCLPAPSQKVFY